MPIMGKSLDKKEVLAFENLHLKGKGRLQIQAELNISRATYYRRLAQMRQNRERSKVGA